MWYTKFNLKKREGNISCPSCESTKEEEIFYSLDLVKCEVCNSDNVFMRTINYIYVFTIEEAPITFKAIYQEVKTKPLKEAYSELLKYSEVFNDELKNDIPNE